MDTENAAEVLEASAWKVSEAMQSLSRCSHVTRSSKKPTVNLCRICMNIEAKLGLISVRLASNPDTFLKSNVRREGLELLGILEAMCTWPRNRASTPQQLFTRLKARLNADDQDSFCNSIQAYLREPYFIIDGVNAICERLHEKLLAEDLDEIDDFMQVSPPEDYSPIHRVLFSTLRKYADCISCVADKPGSWHPTRLFLTSPIRSGDDLVQFDILTSSTRDDSWRDLCILISGTDQSAICVTVDDKSRPPIKKESLRRFCDLFSHDDGCRVSFKLEDKVLVRLGVEALKHRTSQGNGLTLVDVLNRYTLTVSEKIALAHVISLAYCQFYDSQLMYRAWTSHTIWFMPEPSLRDDSERLPMKAYITFCADSSECDFNAAEFISNRPLIHRCPRIQSLAILLLEIGLGKPFQCKTFHHQTQQLNFRHSAALEALEDLRYFTWENFSHKYVFTDAVEACLNFPGLTGKDENGEADSHLLRKHLLHEYVLSRLEWLNKWFQRKSTTYDYLSVKEVMDKPILQYEFAPATHRSKPMPLAPGSSPMVQLENKTQKRPFYQDLFEIAIICALTIEADAVEALFDDFWDADGPSCGKADGDPNTYTTGCIGIHNVVLAHMPGMGRGSSAAVAANCLRSFPKVRLAMVVGVCGAVPFAPTTNKEIILGDVLISDGIVQYDLGRRHATGFARKATILDSLGRPNSEIRTLLAKLKGVRGRRALYEKTAGYLDELQKDSELNAHYPGAQGDWLFKTSYHHVGGGTCQDSGCSDELIPRDRLSEDVPQPAIHFGLVASGDTVMRSAEGRDEIAKSERIIGFEMEGAGVWDIFPNCLVIKGACDYADSHKTKVWQHYAAATAAACAKAFLGHWMPSTSKAHLAREIVMENRASETTFNSKETFQLTIKMQTVP